MLDIVYIEKYVARLHKKIKKTLRLLSKGVILMDSIPAFIEVRNQVKLLEILGENEDTIQYYNKKLSLLRKDMGDICEKKVDLLLSETDDYKFLYKLIYNLLDKAQKTSDQSKGLELAITILMLSSLIDIRNHKHREKAKEEICTYLDCITYILGIDRVESGNISTDINFLFFSLFIIQQNLQDSLKQVKEGEYASIAAIIIDLHKSGIKLENSYYKQIVKNHRQVKEILDGLKQRKSYNKKSVKLSLDMMSYGYLEDSPCIGEEEAKEEKQADSKSIQEKFLDILSFLSSHKILDVTPYSLKLIVLVPT